MLPMSGLISAVGHNPNFDGVQDEVKRAWENVQKGFGRDLPITSGYRDPAHNAAVGGAKGSQHIHGNALDIDVSGLSQDDRLRLIRLASAEGFGGIGVYGNHIHLDVGDRRAWGPSHRRQSVPAWAEETVAQHLDGGFQIAGGDGTETLRGQGEAVFNPKAYEAFKARGGAPQKTPQQPGATFDPQAYEAFKQKQRGRRSQGTGASGVDTTPPPVLEGMETPPESGGIIQGVVDWVQGTGEFDVPELEMSPEAVVAVGGDQRGDLRTALFLADNEQAMANIVQQYSPETEIVADRNGNLYADINGRRYALDKSGWSERDFQEVLKGLGAGLAVHGGARLGQFALGRAGRVIGAGAASGGADAASQALSNMVGGDQPIDLARSAIAAAFGVGGEGISILVEMFGPKVMAGIGRALTGPPQEFETRLLESGFDPAQIQAAFNKIGAEHKIDFGPDALARIAEARSLEPPVELTAGQATRNQALYNQEAIQRGTTGFGDDVQQLAASRAETQQTALAQNAQRLTGEGDVLSRGKQVQDTLVERRARAKAEVDSAYERARNAPGQARIGAVPIRRFVTNLQAKIRQQAVPSAMPLTTEALGELEAMLTATGGKVTALDVRALEAWRSQLSGSLNSATGADRAGLAIVARSYDAAMERAFKNGVVKGDPGTLGMWRNAARLRARFGRNFEADDIVARLTRNAKGRKGELEIDSEDVLGQILGKSTLGSRSGARREVIRLKNLLGADSPQFAAIKSQALVQLLGFEPGAYSGGNISARLVNNLRQANKNHPGLMSALFSDTEIRSLRRFARVVEAINVAPRQAGDPNPSGSAMVGIEAASAGLNRLSNAVEMLGRQLGTGGVVLARIVSRSIQGTGEAAQATAMRRSLMGLPPVASPAPAYPGVGGAVGGIGGPQLGLPTGQ